MGTCLHGIIMLSVNTTMVFHSISHWGFHHTSSTLHTLLFFHWPWPLEHTETPREETLSSSPFVFCDDRGTDDLERLKNVWKQICLYQAPYFQQAVWNIFILNILSGMRQRLPPRPRRWEPDKGQGIWNVAPGLKGKRLPVCLCSSPRQLAGTGWYLCKGCGWKQNVVQYTPW